MKYTLRVRPAADADVDDIATFIAQDNVDAALRLYDAVEEVYERLKEHPLRFPKYEIDHARLVGLRKCSIPGFRSYLIFFRLQDRIVEVIRVLHGAREIPSVLDGEG